MTAATLRSVQSTLPQHVTVHGFTGPKTGPSAIENKVDAVVSACECFRALAPIMKETPDRFDAFLVACFSAHPLISMLREEYTQPTIGIMEAALYASRMCGEKLGVVTTSSRSSINHAKSIADYGLAAHSVGCETGKIAVLELESKPKDVVYAGLSAAAKRLVANGADCICLGCAGMTEMQAVCQEAVDMEGRKAMVVDGVTMGVHFLTGLVRENLGIAKGGSYQSAADNRVKRGQADL